MATQQQMVLADIIGTIALIITIAPFLFSVVGIYNDVYEKRGFSLIGAIVKIYIVQLLISFSFFVFVRFWDLLVKKDDYKLQGSGHAFANFWGDCNAGLSSANTETLKSLYAYICIITPIFRALLAYGVFLLPLIVFYVSYSRLPQSKSNYVEGENVIENLFKAFMYTFFSILLMYVYLDIANISLFYQGGSGTITQMIQDYWKNLLQK